VLSGCQITDQRRIVIGTAENSQLYRSAGPLRVLAGDRCTLSPAGGRHAWMVPWSACPVTTLTIRLRRYPRD
jgi:hypothetical protein